MNIRCATAADAADCVAIYAPFVRDTVISFEDVAPDIDEMAARIARLTASHGWLVGEENGRVVGFAYAGVFRQRQAWQWVCETSIYLAPAAMGRGLGRQLYAALLSHLTECGYRVAIGCIALPNEASTRLHEAVGFQSMGVFRRVGFKFDTWIDVAWYQAELGSGTATPPDPLQLRTSPSR